MRTTVITIASGRTEHLDRQCRALKRTDGHVVVAMGRDEAPRCRSTCGASSDVLVVEPTDRGLPLAAARNAGATHALHRGAELLVFLDVDCIPGGDLTARYRAAARAEPGALLCGPVGHLPPAPPGGYPETGLAASARVVGGRPVPPPDELWTGGDHRMLWTLSFAITAAGWARVGGFDETYVGYGGEDTDFGQRAREAQVGLCWVGGAWAFHQHHPTQTPPVQHLEDILRNAAIFRNRWGWWPMEGWLRAFADRGLAHYDPGTDRWLSGAPPRRPDVLTPRSAGEVGVS